MSNAKKTEEVKPKQYLIVLKTKDKEGTQMYISADELLPTMMFGEGHPMVLATTGDHGFFIPLSSIEWFEQMHGVLQDKKFAQELLKQKRNRTETKFTDVNVM